MNVLRLFLHFPLRTLRNLREEKDSKYGVMNGKRKGGQNNLLS
jgi:hypothetical protein